MRILQQRIIRWGVRIAAVLSLLALAARDVQFDRTIVAEADILRNRATAYLSALGPSGRVERTREGVRMIGEPTYVTVRVPRWFSRATVELTADGPVDVPLRVGIRTHPIAWTFNFPEVGASPRSFTLDRSWQVERNTYQFMFAASGVAPERPFVIHALRVVAERDPICVARWCF